MTEQQSLEWDANTVMEQIHMAESRHMQMGALCSYLLQYPDMTIRDFLQWHPKRSEKKRRKMVIMSNIHNEILLENIYDEVWEEYRIKHNLTSDQLYALEQNADTGTIVEITVETTRRFDAMCQ